MINSVGNQLGNRCVLQGPSNNNENFIQNKDTDGDGLLNAQELGAPEEDFVKIDTNGDGLADKEELTIAYINRNRSAHMGNRPNQFIKNKDADGDGLLTPEELGLSEEDFANTLSVSLSVSAFAAASRKLPTSGTGSEETGSILILIIPFADWLGPWAALPINSGSKHSSIGFRHSSCLTKNKYLSSPFTR